ncbi:glycosyl transferase family 90 [Leptospira sp. 96542]|nr:glycosyl transferase family 90 [Leptospira sp. 96542]
MKNIFRKNQPSKFAFYVGNILSGLTPDFLSQAARKKILSQYQRQPEAEIDNRVTYYNKLGAAFTPSAQATTLKELSPTDRSAYYLDFRSVARYFPSDLIFDRQFGDVDQTPSHPTFVKARPLEGDNSNAVLLKLNSVRHFNLVDDSVPFEAKLDKVVWRGATNSWHHRADMLRRYFNNPLCDVGVNKPFFDTKSTDFVRPSMSLDEQLRYKFVLSLEGNDVATNLKWIMSSNSLAFMRRPRFETWFMEGRLQAGVHYVLLKDDFSDLEEKIDYYSTHAAEARDIVQNANRYVAQFRDRRRERLISLLVLQKYFLLSGQIPVGAL